MATVVRTSSPPGSPSPSSPGVIAGLPPGPSNSTIVQTYRYVRKPLPLLDECAQRFGHMFTIRLIGTGPWVFLCSPDLLKTLFTAPADVVHAGEANASVFGPLTGEGSVFTMDESSHLERRRLLLPQFHGDRMQLYFEQIRDIASGAVSSWRRGVAFAMRPQTQQMTLQAIIRAVFGIQPDEGDARDRALVKALTDLANDAVGSSLVLAPPFQRDLGPWSPWGRVLRIIGRSDMAIQHEITRRRAASNVVERHDILSLLLQTSYDDGTKLTDREIRDELVVMLMAGHETTGTALAWAFERILSLPDVEQRLRAELAAVVGAGTLSAAHLQRLEYLDAVVKESLRVRPIMPAGGARLVQRPFQIGGYVMPPGTSLINCMYILHRRADLYPDPDSFKPERFLGKRVIDPYEWTPFGGGVRRCLGMAFALFEMKTVIATVLSRARLRIENPDARVARRGFFLTPEGGPRVTLEDRYFT
jgi:cytochrome P450 family 110